MPDPGWPEHRNRSPALPLQLVTVLEGVREAHVTLEEFFAGHEKSRRIFKAVHEAITDFGLTDVRVTKSQVAFRRRIGFAFVWIPDMYLGKVDVPLVLTVGLRRRDGSPRWKQVVEPRRGRFTHHLELHDPSDVDAQVRDWLYEAWTAAA
jgi:hypothetical protein